MWSDGGGHWGGGVYLFDGAGIFSSSSCSSVWGAFGFVFFGMSCFVVLLLLLLCFRQSIPDFVFGLFFFFFFTCVFLLLPSRSSSSVSGDRSFVVLPFLPLVYLESVG